MSPQATSREDARGFRWRFAALTRKLEHELTRARGDLQELRLAQERLDLRVGETQRERNAHDRRRAREAAGGLDTGLHLHSVHYLVRLDRLVRTTSEQSAAHRGRVSAAASACEVLERRLASLEEMRLRAQADYTREQSRLRYKEADLEWLARKASTAPDAAMKAPSPC